MTRIKGTLKLKCTRCGWLLERVGRQNFCTNSTCFYHTTAHRSGKSLPKAYNE